MANPIQILNSVNKSQDGGNSPHAILLIFNGRETPTPRSRKIFCGMLHSDVTLNGTATYSSVLEGMSNKANDGINKASALASSLGANSLAGAMGGIQAKTLAQTIVSWSSSDKPVFTVPMVFVDTDGRTAPETYAADLVSYTLAHGAADSSSTTTLLRAPGGFKPAIASDSRSGESFEGTWTLRFGDWFEAHNLLLVSTDFSASPIINRSETGIHGPSTSTGTVTLSPARAVTNTEYRNYFKRQ